MKILYTQHPTIYGYLIEAASDWKEFKAEGYKFYNSIEQSVDEENMLDCIAEKVVWEYGLTNALELWDMNESPKVWQLAGRVLYHLLTQEVVEKQMRRKVVYEDEEQWDFCEKAMLR